MRRRRGPTPRRRHVRRGPPAGTRTQVQWPSSTARSALLLALIEARQLDVLTVPLGALADAYLDALGRLEADRLGQRQLVRGRRQPAHPDQEPGDAAAPDATGRCAARRTRAPIPRPSCGRACILYRAYRDAGRALADEALGADRAVPARAGGRPRGRPRRRRARRTRRRSIRLLLVRALDRLVASSRRRPTAARDHGPDDHASPSGRPSSAPRFAGARRSSSRTSSPASATGSSIAVTFLAMLELIKRREIVVEQAEPWGPIVARATTPEERAAAGIARRRRRTRRSTRRWSPSRDASAIEPADARRPRRRTTDGPAEAGDARADRADRGGARGAPVRRRAPLSRREIATLAGVDRATSTPASAIWRWRSRARGIRLVVDGDRVELATAPEGGALVARYLGADAVRLSPASLETLAIVAYRQPVTKAAVERIRGVDSDYTIRTLLHRRLVVELGRSDAPGRPFLYGTGFEFLERFGLTSLDELPPLDVDVAARLAEEGGRAADRPAVRPADGARRRRPTTSPARRGRPDGARAAPEGARRGRRRLAARRARP